MKIYPWHVRRPRDVEKKKAKKSCMRCPSRLYLWKVVGLFLTSTKEKQTDGPLSMGTGECHWPRREAQKGENRNWENKLFHRHANQIQSPAVSASNSRNRDSDLRAELVDHTLFEMSGWLIVYQWRALEPFTAPAGLIYQVGSIFTCDLTNSSSFSKRLCYWFNRWAELFAMDLIEWKEHFRTGDWMDRFIEL